MAPSTGMFGINLLAIPNVDWGRSAEVEWANGRIIAPCSPGVLEVGDDFTPLLERRFVRSVFKVAKESCGVSFTHMDN